MPQLANNRKDDDTTETQPMHHKTLPAILLTLICTASNTNAGTFTGSILDADTEKPLPARVYLQSEAGTWLYVKTASPKGSAFPYKEQWVPQEGAVEKHTTISAHPFRADLKPGKYTVSIERGKEYLPLTKTITVTDQPTSETFRIQRWSNIAGQGWYSGETHVHRRIPELPNVMLAEDLNVAFPVTFWTINAHEAPVLDPSPLRRQGPSPFGPRQDAGYEMITVDKTHVMFPRNTEYEVFSVKGKRHVLGAVFLLNHKSVFKTGMPPVAQLAEQAHKEGALLDLDKHNWPWSMMLVPIAKVDLYELSNNSVWRTKFMFKRTNTEPADYMNVERDGLALTEWGWLNFGFENYYTLLNCGFRLSPTAGTASGVHPVPLGYSRVYVHLENKFDPQAWLKGLKAGRSFVTTGPMLTAQVEKQYPGHIFKQNEKRSRVYNISGEANSEHLLDRIEILVNGEIQQTIKPQNKKTRSGAYKTELSHKVLISETSWIALRCIEYTKQNRPRFAPHRPLAYRSRRRADPPSQRRSQLPDPPHPRRNRAKQGCSAGTGVSGVSAGVEDL